MAVKCQIREHKEAKRCRIRPRYAYLVDLRTGRIKGDAFNACCLTFVRPLELMELGHRGFRKIYKKKNKFVHAKYFESPEFTK